jgi:hypothetical protein
MPEVSAIDTEAIAPFSFQNEFVAANHCRHAIKIHAAEL